MIENSLKDRFRDGRIISGRFSLQLCFEAILAFQDNTMTECHSIREQFDGLVLAAMVVSEQSSQAPVVA
jgi:hypothetical protein